MLDAPHTGSFVQVRKVYETPSGVRMSKYWKAMASAVVTSVLQVPLPAEVPMWLRVVNALVSTATVFLAPKNKG